MAQRVSSAGVDVDGRAVASIGKGILALVGVASTDGEEEAAKLADKLVNLRIFEDEEGKMNLSLRQVGGEALVVSQFTLYADCRKGRRPSFAGAAEPAHAERMYEMFAQRLRELGVRVGTGIFGARMRVRLVNDGPVTLILDSEHLRGREGMTCTSKDS